VSEIIRVCVLKDVMGGNYGGHNYITVVVDITESKVIYVGDGRDSAVISKFRADLEAHNGKAENIEIVCSDM
jgi:hypothetical protein